MNTPPRSWFVSALLSVCILLLAACGGSSGGDPGDVVKKYVSALSEGDIKTAVQCIDPAKQNQAGKMMEMGAALASAFVKAEGGLDSVKILSVQTEGDKARVAYQTKTKKGMERSDNVRTEKINGKWYVAP